MLDRARFETLAYTALRVVAGFLFLWHGSQKLLGFPGAKPSPELFSQMWFGGIIELIGGTMIALGLLTRPAAFVASGTMAVAYLQFHWKGAFDANFLPLVNRGEAAVLFCFVFLFIFARGAGPFSIDRHLGRA
jgi:putative oxidoreductase